MKKRVVLTALALCLVVGCSNRNETIIDNWDNGSSSADEIVQDVNNNSVNIVESTEDESSNSEIDSSLVMHTNWSRNFTNGDVILPDSLLWR